MITIRQARAIALSFEEAVEIPHFERASFRVRKKIFATMDEKEGIVVLMFTPVEQSVFAGFDREAIYPVAGGWGARGATVFELSKIEIDLFEDAINVAYCLKAPKALAAKYAGKVK